MAKHSRAYATVGVAVSLFALIGCDSGRSMPTTPAASRGEGIPTASFERGGQDGTVQVSLRDNCDPASFDAALGDPNGCVKNSGGMPFNTFVAVLTRNQTIAPWAITPFQANLAPGTVLAVTNVGGEAHTFTRVASFGGGFVGLLNTLSGNTTPVAECNPATVDILPAGGTQSVVVADDGTENYQCCIHPWMRMVVNGKKS